MYQNSALHELMGLRHTKDQERLSRAFMLYIQRSEYTYSHVGSRIRFARTVNRFSDFRIIVCCECQSVIYKDDAKQWPGSGVLSCTSCYEYNWTPCHDCGTLMRRYDGHQCLVETDGDTGLISLCSTCRVRLHWCEDHEVYTRTPHTHPRACMDHVGSFCPVPYPTFRFPVGPGEWVENEQIFHVAVPKGVIADEGITEIYHYLAEFYPDNVAHGIVYECDIDPLWQTRQGNYTKRVSRVAYKNYDVQIEDIVLQRIGNIARQHTIDETFLHLSFTRDLNQKREFFANDHSCWWTNMATSRCYFKSNGGLGLRSLDEDGNPLGRAWILPLHINDLGRLRAGHSTSADAYIIFNGYGNLGSYTPARLLGQFTGKTYKKISFTDRHMYVNREHGYLVANQELIQQYGQGLHLSLRQHADLPAPVEEAA